MPGARYLMIRTTKDKLKLHAKFLPIWFWIIKIMESQFDLTTGKEVTKLNLTGGIRSTVNIVLYWRRFAVTVNKFRPRRHAVRCRPRRTNFPRNWPARLLARRGRLAFGFPPSLTWTDYWLTWQIKGANLPSWIGHVAAVAAVGRPELYIAENVALAIAESILLAEKLQIHKSEQAVAYKVTCINLQCISHGWTWKKVCKKYYNRKMISI